MDTELGYIGLLLEVHGAEIAQGRVPACGIVEALDVIEHVLFCVVARAVGFARDPFGLQRGEEALHRSVVPDVAVAAHRACYPVVGHQSLELLAGILAALVRVVQQRIGFATPPDRGLSGISCAGGRLNITPRMLMFTLDVSRPMFTLGAMF